MAKFCLTSHGAIANTTTDTAIRDMVKLRENLRFFNNAFLVA